MADAPQEAIALERAKLEQEKERLIQEMALERARLRQEIDLKTQQLAHEEKLRVLQLDQEKELKSKEIENQATQLSKVQWSSPAVVAVIAGFLGIGTTLVTTYESGVQTRELERQKQEGTIILEAIKTGGTGADRAETAAANLVLFADAGLITIPDDKLKTIRKKAGDTSPSLPSNNSTNPSSQNSKAYEKIKQDLAYAVNYLNQRFRTHLDVPVIKPPDFTNDRNAYWDGTQYIAPPNVQFLPDITYVEAVHPYLDRTAHLLYRGESGALYNSYACVFASLIKQKRLNQKAETADWTIAPKGIAWILGEDLTTTRRNEPLTSLKAPGTAYNDPVVGKDKQVAHMRDYVHTDENDVFSDNGGVHTNCGIPNKAFYETAIVIGSEKAGDIWYEALLKLKPKSGFHDAAVETIKAAGTLYGANSPEQKAVTQAWKTVGVNTAP